MDESNKEIDPDDGFIESWNLVRELLKVGKEVAKEKNFEPNGSFLYGFQCEWKM